MRLRVLKYSCHFQRWMPKQATSRNEGGASSRAIGSRHLHPRGGHRDPWSGTPTVKLLRVDRGQSGATSQSANI
jgi:hypothetical protein